MLTEESHFITWIPLVTWGFPYYSKASFLPSGSLHSFGPLVVRWLNKQHVPIVCGHEFSVNALTSRGRCPQRHRIKTREFHFPWAFIYMLYYIYIFLDESVGIQLFTFGLKRWLNKSPATWYVSLNLSKLILFFLLQSAGDTIQIIF